MFLDTYDLPVFQEEDRIRGARAADGRGVYRNALAPGKKADMIAVRGSPLEDIHALREIAMVMQGGKKYVG